MKLQLDTGNSPFAISSYRPGEIVINHESLSRSLVVGPSGLLRDWGPVNVAGIEAHHLEAIMEMSPEVVLLGTGRRQAFPDPTVFRPLMAAGVGLEVMDTGAACRTYNILLAEGRRIAAALIMID